MKDIAPKLIGLLKGGYCTPQLGRLGRTLREPVTTLQYNVKKLEREGVVHSYKAVFDYKKINEGHCTYLLINLEPSKYGEPEEVSQKIAKNPSVESVDVITGDYEIIVKLRCKDIDEYYAFVKQAIKQYGISKVISLTSLKQVKTEFVNCDN